MAFFLPLLGMVGLLALVYPALGRRAVPEEACQWRHPGVPALAEPQARNGEPASGLRNLDAMLRHASDASTRMDALMRALKLSDARAAALLRKALKDTDEEVRLLAYALLNRKEKAIEARIHARRTALDTLDPHESFAHRKALAYDYWELAHLGGTHRAADSPLNAYVCEYAQSALALNPVDGGLQLLLGRALILQGQLAAAERCLLHAQQCGMGTDKTAPYLAEVAYLSRQFGSVRQLLQGPGSAAQHPKLENAWNFWEGVRREATAS